MFQGVTHLFVFTFVGNDNSCWLIFLCLLYEHVSAAVGSQHVSLIQVGVLLDDLECLGTYAASATQDAYFLSFLHKSNNPVGRCMVMRLPWWSMSVIKSSAAGISRFPIWKRTFCVLSST